MHPWYFFIFTFFFLEILCDQQQYQSIGKYRQNRRKFFRRDTDSAVEKSYNDDDRDNQIRLIREVESDFKVINDPYLGSNKNSTNNSINSVIKSEATKGSSGIPWPKDKSKPSTTKIIPTVPHQTVLLANKVQHSDAETVSDKNDSSEDTSSSSHEQVKGDNTTVKKDEKTKTTGDGPHFDEKAIQRAFMVCGGLGTIILIYFGIKFVFIKKRKSVRRYGRVESSEMDLLENIEEDEDESEDDTLFDITSHRDHRA